MSAPNNWPFCDFVHHRTCFHNGYYNFAVVVVASPLLSIQPARHFLPVNRYKSPLWTAPLHRRSLHYVARALFFSDAVAGASTVAHQICISMRAVRGQKRDAALFNFCNILILFYAAGKRAQCAQRTPTRMRTSSHTHTTQHTTHTQAHRRA